MDKIIAKLKTEPVRVRLYSLIVALSTFLQVKGVIDVTDAGFIAVAAALVLGVEAVRAKVTPAPPAEPKHKL